MADELSSLDKLKQIGENLVMPAIAMKVIEALPYPLVIVDHKGRIVEFNEEAVLMFSYTRSEAIGEAVELLLPEMLKDIHKQHRADFMNAPRARPMGLDKALTGKTKDGREFSVEVFLRPIVEAEGIFVMAALRRPSAEKDKNG